jgi:hypothetical protein
MSIKKRGRGSVGSSIMDHIFSESPPPFEGNFLFNSTSPTPESISTFTEKHKKKKKEKKEKRDKKSKKKKKKQKKKTENKTV